MIKNKKELVKKSRGNCCVPEALSGLTGIDPVKIANIVKTGVKGTKTDVWTSDKVQKKVGFTYTANKKPTIRTVKQLNAEAKKHKSGIIVRIGDPMGVVQGTHVIHINQKGQLTGKEKKHASIGMYKVHGIGVKQGE